MIKRILGAVALATAFTMASFPGHAAKPAARSADVDLAQQMMANINVGLAADGSDYQLGVIEYLTSGEGDQMGRTVFFRNRGNKLLGQHFVPGDPRRGGGTDISWIIDENDATLDVSTAVASAAIRRAMDTWQAETCSVIPLTDLGDSGDVDLGVVQDILGFGGSPDVVADVTYGGWAPAAFFDALADGGSNFILAVTFTFVFVDADGVTDIDHNFRADTAFREIYYNDNFPWADGSTFDIETVSLHEAGHGLSQGHFGEAFRDGGKGKLHFDPRAVMNAAYSGVQNELTGTDIGGHCANWASWPQN